MSDHDYTVQQIAALLGRADGGTLAMRTYIHAEVLDVPACIDTALTGDGSTAGSTPAPKLTERQAPVGSRGADLAKLPERRRTAR